MSAELRTVTLAELKHWASGLWKRCYGRALVQGNLLSDEAMALVDKVEKVRQSWSSLRISSVKNLGAFATDWSMRLLPTLSSP